MNGVLFALLLSLGAAFLVSILLFLIYKVYRKHTMVDSYDEQLEELLADENEEEVGSKNVSLIYRWNRHWSNVLHGAFDRYANNDSTAGRDVFIVGIIITVVISALFRNIFAGLLFAGALIWLFDALMRSKNEKNVEKINRQLPGFLSSFKSNISVGHVNTNQAFINVVDSTPSPLYEDVKIVADKLKSNSSLQESLEALEDKTVSRELKFLAASIIQAIDSPKSIVEEIEVIQDILAKKRQAAYAREKAVQEARPGILVTSFAIPICFILMYFFDSETRDFWFVQPISWVGLIVTGVLWAIGMLLTKHVVDKVKNL